MRSEQEHHRKPVANKPGYFVDTVTDRNPERQARKRLCKRLQINNRELKKRNILRLYQLIRYKDQSDKVHIEYAKREV